MAKLFTAENFESEVLNADKPVLVDFYADWCGPCKMMAPVVEQLAVELEGRVSVGKMNVDDNYDIASRYKVMSIPTLILFKGGQAVSKRIGLQSKEEIDQMLSEV